METRDVGIIVVMSVLAITLIFMIVMLATGTKTIRPVDGLEKYSDYEKILINRAHEIFQQEQSRGRDFTSGPCLSEDLDINWVLDIAHKPRVAADDLPENQCQRFLRGEARHFIELSPNGEVLKVK